MSENLNVFITPDENFLWYLLKKSKFSFYFIVYTPMRVSDIITNVTKQNMKSWRRRSVLNMRNAGETKQKKKKIGKSK